MTPPRTPLETLKTFVRAFLSNYSAVRSFVFENRVFDRDELEAALASVELEIAMDSGMTSPANIPIGTQLPGGGVVQADSPGGTPQEARLDLDKQRAEAVLADLDTRIFYATGGVSSLVDAARYWRTRAETAEAEVERLRASKKGK